MLLLKQGRKCPYICINCNKRGTFRDRKREREKVLGYYTIYTVYLLSIVKIKREKEREEREREIKFDKK